METGIYGHTWISIQFTAILMGNMMIYDDEPMDFTGVACRCHMLQITISTIFLEKCRSGVTRGMALKWDDARHGHRDQSGYDKQNCSGVGASEKIEIWIRLP